MTRTARPTLLSLWGIRINTRSSVIPTPFLISIKHLRDKELVCCCLVKDFFNHLMRCARNSVCQVNYFLRSSRITFLNLRPVHKSTLRYIVQLQLFSQRMKHYSEIFSMFDHQDVSDTLPEVVGIKLVTLNQFAFIIHINVNILPSL